VQPVRHHLAAWDAHTGKAWGDGSCLLCPCSPAQPSSRLQSRSGEQNCGSPARLTPAQGTGRGGGFRLLARWGDASLHGYLRKGLHCNAV